MDDYGHCRAIAKEDVVLGSLQISADWNALAWIDTSREMLCFADRTFRLDMLDADQRAMLSRIAYLSDWGFAFEYRDAVERELTPLVMHLWRSSTN